MTRSSHFRFAALAVVIALTGAACGDDAEPVAAQDTASETSSVGDAPSDVAVVASTTWTGAYASLAGATDITVIAPTSVLHPPDYDPRASDLVAAADADLVVYAEFESFATRLVDAAGSDATAFAVTLENTTATIETEVMRLAAELGTTDQARANLDEFLPAAEALGAEVAELVSDPAPIAVTEVFMTYWAQWAGLESAGSFGPQPLTAGDLAGMLDLSPTLVIDNLHVPGGQALEAEGIPRIELINYPGEDLDLLAVFRHNHDLFAAALAGEVTADPDVAVPAGEGAGHDHGESASADAGHDHGESASADAGHEHGG